MQGAAELHVLNQVGALTLIWGDDADLVRFGSSLKQPGGDLLYVGSLSPTNIYIKDEPFHSHLVHYG